VTDVSDPPDAADTHPNFRWRKALRNVHSPDDNDEHLAAYACRRTSDRTDAAVERVTITYYERFVYDDTGPTIETELLEYEC
jgi:hypothetical protein